MSSPKDALNHSPSGSSQVSALPALSLEQRVKLFAALADPTRLRIVECLMAQSEASGSALAKQLDISLALFCHHSKTLITVGLVKARKQGQTKFLSLNQPLLQQCYAPFQPDE
ncbi:MAG: metalloregulator ArsR/SmtB family transcription factor [Cyanobacteria bacterium P01_A01_bin.116]